MKDCSSSGKTAFNGLLIKSSSLRGNCHDIHIDDFRAEDEIYLQVANNNTFITNVVLKNININNPEGYGVIIGNQSADILNNDVKDVSIDGLTGVADKAIMCAWADDIYNLSFKNININYSSKLLDFVRINNFENITLNNKKIK